MNGTDSCTIPAASICLSPEAENQIRNWLSVVAASDDPDRQVPALVYSPFGQDHSANGELLREYGPRVLLGTYRDGQVAESDLQDFLGHRVYLRLLPSAEQHIEAVFIRESDGLLIAEFNRH